MSARLFITGFGLFASISPVLAQFPSPPSLPQSGPVSPARGPAPYQPGTSPVQVPPPVALPDPVAPSLPSYPVQPVGGSVPVPAQGPLNPPGMLPPSVVPSQPLQPRAVSPSPLLFPAQPAFPGANGQPTVPVEVTLPQPENKFPIDTGSITLKRIRGGWQAWAGQRLLRDFGEDEAGARDFIRVIRELRPTEWVTIGTAKPFLEYGLTNGKPAMTGGFPRMAIPVDLQTVRVEAVRGVWCLRDDRNILINFELDKPDAEQALAVIRRYGFNCIGMVGGNLAMPAMRYCFFSPNAADEARRQPVDQFTLAAQEQSLARTGIPVPGVGYFGLSMKIDPRKVEVRKDGYEWVIAHGADVIGRFGAAEFTAHEALRIIRDGQFTEFCTAGSSGLTFFLVNGQAPTRVPYSTQGRQFDLGSLKVHQLGNRWAVTENGRHLFDVGSREEGESLIRLLKHFQFDQVCQVGSSPRASLKFLARSR